MHSIRHTRLNQWPQAMPGAAFCSSRLVGPVRPSQITGAPQTLAQPMAHPDFDELLNFLIPFAQQMLSKHGEFFPFGAMVSATGEVTAEAAYDGDEQPPSERIIDLLTGAFRQKAAERQIRAAGI